MGPLHYFLGVDMKRIDTGFFLSQTKYAEELLDHAGMVSCKPAATPIDTKGKAVVHLGRLRQRPERVLQHHRRTTIPHHHQARHRVRRAASMPAYA